MIRPTIQSHGLEESEPILVKSLFSSEQLAIRYCGYLMDDGLSATVCTAKDRWCVVADVRAKDVERLNFAFYLLEEWINA